ncbi:MAG TPA: hypothetical protein DFH97_07235, partial [Clostridiales bacterium]|nr:hypothetical protein [Clostridiales bacterium]
TSGGATGEGSGTSTSAGSNGEGGGSGNGEGNEGENHTHTWGPWTDDGNGKHTRKCTDCDATETEDHDYAYTSDGNGKHVGTCKLCGATTEPEDCKQAAKPRHVGDADNKEHEYYCELCDATIKKEKCSKTITKATCVTPATCTECGQTYGSVDPDAHKWVVKPNGDGKTHSEVCEYCNEKNADYGVKICAKASKPRHIEGTETHEYYCKDCGVSMGKAEACTKKYVNTKNGTHKVLCKVCDAVLVEKEDCTSDPSTDRCGKKAYCQYCYVDFGDKLGHDFSSGGGCARFPEGRCSCTKESHRKLWNKNNASQSTVKCDKCHTDVEKEKIRADFTVSGYDRDKSISGLKVSTSSKHVKYKSRTVNPDSGKFAADQDYAVTVAFTTDPGYEVTYATIGGSAATLTDSHDAATGNLPRLGSVFTVTYDNMGKGKLKNPTETVQYPGKAHPETLTATGYVFGGWYMDKEFTTAFNAKVPVAADITVYAKWSVARTLTFKANSGKISPSSKNFADGEVVDLKDYTPTRKGYWFCGWFKDKDLTGRKLATIKMDANKTVYAKWKKEDTTNPKTGDNSGWAVGILTLTTVLGAAAVVTKKKRVW